MRDCNENLTSKRLNDKSILFILGATLAQHKLANGCSIKGKCHIIKKCTLTNFHYFTIEKSSKWQKLIYPIDEILRL